MFTFRKIGEAQHALIYDLDCHIKIAIPKSAIPHSPIASLYVKGSMPLYANRLIVRNNTREA